VASPGEVTIPHAIAHQLTESRRVHAADLAASIQEVEIETQIQGASFLKLHVIDPHWLIIKGGLLAVNEDGLLNEVECEFPEYSGYQWRLAAVEGTTEIGGANAVLTFEDAIVARLRQQWGHRTIPPGLTTRAQFVRNLVNEANAREHLNPPIKFVSPGINRVEPVAESTQEKQAKLETPKQKQAKEAREGKTRGIHPGAEVKVKGSAATPQQLADINTALDVANKLSAGTTATLALIVAGIGESDFNRNSSNPSGHNGVWQSSTIPGNEVEKQAHFFLKGGESFQAGGAIKLAEAGKEPGDIATKVEASGEAADFYGKYLPEAEAILHAGGGVRTGGSTPTSSNESDVGQLSRGMPENPDEDSWDCINRLAAEVNWSVFTDGKDTLYYMDGPDLIRQKPVLYIDGHNHKNEPQPPSNWRVIREDKGGRKVEHTGALIRPLTFTYDNTAFLYRASHKVKGKVQRRSRRGIPQSPAEVRMNMLCGMTEFHAGEVFVFRNCGPISENGGRWIVSDVTRLCLKNPYSSFILVPPGEPLKEPQAQNTTSPEVSAEGYVNPFGKIANLVPARIDMGVDYGGTGQIIALGDAKVYSALSSSGWEGGAFIGYTLTSGQFAGKSVYHAENIKVACKPGDELKAGQLVGFMTGGTESGWGTGRPQEALAASLGQQGHGDPGGVETPAGASFNRLLVKLGCVSGTKNSGGMSTNGKPLPTGYP
jgi:hypothetical protein